MPATRADEFVVIGDRKIPSSEKRRRRRRLSASPGLMLRPRLTPKIEMYRAGEC